jgi:hypothetical protein
MTDVREVIGAATEGLIFQQSSAAPFQVILIVIPNEERDLK